MRRLSLLVLLAAAGCAPSTELDAPSPMDAPPACCPIDPGTAACSCYFRVGGSPGPTLPCDSHVG